MTRYPFGPPSNECAFCTNQLTCRVGSDYVCDDCAKRIERDDREDADALADDEREAA